MTTGWASKICTLLASQFFRWRPNVACELTSVVVMVVLAALSTAPPMIGCHKSLSGSSEIGDRKPPHEICQDAEGKEGRKKEFGNGASGLLPKDPKDYLISILYTVHCA